MADSLEHLGLPLRSESRSRVHAKHSRKSDQVIDSEKNQALEILEAKAFQGPRLGLVTLSSKNPAPRGNSGSDQSVVSN